MELVLIPSKHRRRNNFLFSYLPVPVLLTVVSDQRCLHSRLLAVPYRARNLGGVFLTLVTL